MKDKFDWKCDICGTGFNNFQAQGFNNKIYCPLCYFKHEFNNYKKAWEELFRKIENNGSDASWNAETQDWYLDLMQELEQKYDLVEDMER